MFKFKSTKPRKAVNQPLNTTSQVLHRNNLEELEMEQIRLSQNITQMHEERSQNIADNARTTDINGLIKVAYAMLDVVQSRIKIQRRALEQEHHRRIKYNHEFVKQARALLTPEDYSRIHQSTNRCI